MPRDGERMTLSLASSLLVLAVAALGVHLLQHVALWLHCAPRHRPRRREEDDPTPGISVLKPLCGVDDRLEQNLATFAWLDHRDYEVVLGVQSTADAAWPVALAAVRKWPHRFRVVVQRGEPGYNPKVNQLIGLARAARHDVLVVSDSNVCVDADYLSGIAEALRDPEVGLVTHPVAGVGERRLGSLFDNLHLVGAVAPGMVASKLLAGQDVVVGKSMALRRADLEALGGFEAVKDVLAEDWVIGRWIRRRLGKRVVVARAPVANVNERRRVSDFYGRYARWSVMQRKAVGLPIYLAQLGLHPVPLALLALLARPSGEALLAFLAVGAFKAAVDGVSGRVLRRRPFDLADLALVPLKDLVFGAAWLHGLLRDDVVWRGHRLRVLRGTRLAPAATRPARAALRAAAVR
jgi:ceramide glucosyltransferase